jgi:hypothetical protein
MSSSPSGDQASTVAEAPYEGPTSATGPLNWVRDAFFVHQYGPTAARDVRGIWLTSFVGACDKTKATSGALLLRIDFSAEAGEIPVGTYPIADTFAPEPMAIATVWSVLDDGCSGQGTTQTRLVSGTVNVTSSDETGVAGTFEGSLVGATPQTVHGTFVAPRCATVGGEGACRP